MKEFKRSATQSKILGAMDQVYEKLIEFKKKNNSELVIMKDDKVIRIKPKSL